MERNKEHWLNQTLNSLDGIQPAPVPAGLHNSIMARLRAEKFRIITDNVSTAMVYRIAAGLLIIITVNVLTCVAVLKNTTKQKEQQSFMKTYFAGETNDDLLNI